jgi:hypothetical protein
MMQRVHDRGTLTGERIGQPGAVSQLLESTMLNTAPARSETLISS